MFGMNPFRPPEPIAFDENRAISWRSFQSDFMYFMKASGLQKADEEVRVASFLNLIGKEGRDIFATFQWKTGEDKNKLADVMKKFEDYCIPLTNVVFERYRFFSRIQQEGETIDEYLTSLRLLIKSCEFATVADIEESLLRDKLVMGCKDTSLKERLLREANVSFSNALHIAHASEITRKHIAEVNSREAEVNLIKRNQIRPQQQNVCSRCGVKHVFNNCPAYGKQCHNCKTYGHFAKQCRSSRRRTVREIDNANECEESVSWLSVNMVAKSDIYCDKWTCGVKVGREPIQFKIDSGADVNVIPFLLFKKLNKQSKIFLETTAKKLKTYTNDTIPVKGEIRIALKYKEKSYWINAFVVETNSPPILGKPGIETLGLIERVQSIKDDTVQENDVFRNYPGLIEGEHNIQLKENSKPVSQSPRKFPFAIQKKLEEELYRLEHLGLIEKVTEPTLWTQQMAIVTKKDGSLRVCLDARELNKCVVPEHFNLPTAEEIYSRMHGAKYFSFLDATQGFHHIKLTQESSLLTTFHTPFGRYKWLRLPYGLVSASEIFHRRMKECFEGCQGVEIFIDDIAVWGTTKEEHDVRLRQVLERCKKTGIHLNKKKCRIGVQEATYLGHIVSSSGLKVDPKKVEAVRNMPHPRTKEELHRFLGMITYLSKFIPDCSIKTQPLRKLMKKGIKFEWTEEQEKAYQVLINMCSQAPTLAFFNPHKKLTVSVDACQDGLGVCLLQEGQPIAYGSCSLTETQRKYAQIEKEMLAIVYGCQRFSQFIWGRPVEIETDHKPLETIFKKPMADISPRLLRMLMKLQNYNLTVRYKPGRQLLLADHLSRSHLNSTVICQKLEKSLEMQVLTVSSPLSLPETSLQKYQTATAGDSVLQGLGKLIKYGWPEHKNQLEDPELKNYWSVKEDLYQHDGLIFRGHQLVIPAELRKTLLKQMHYDHGGITKTLARAREAIYWPKMNHDIKRVIESCFSCQTMSRSNEKQPMIVRNLPEYPFQRVSMDYFECLGRKYLVIIDAFSHWFDIFSISSTDFISLEPILTRYFSDHGYPEEVFTDNGPPFSSQRFMVFCKDRSIKHVTSSPNYAQSNGLAERAVQTAKKLVIKCHESKLSINDALLEYRNAPFASKLPSPSELALGRKLRSNFPYNKELLKQKFHSLEDVTSRYYQYKEKQKQYYDRGTRHFNELKENESVLIQEGRRWCEGKVMERCRDAPRSYNIKKKNGVLIRRNRKQLKRWFGGAGEEIIQEENQEEGNRRAIDEEAVMVENEQHRESVTTSRYGREIRPPRRYGFSEDG
jgi:hypothetical protein